MDGNRKHWASVCLERRKGYVKGWVSRSVWTLPGLSGEASLIKEREFLRKKSKTRFFVLP